MTKYIFSLSLLLAALLPVAAQNPGSLDTSFGNQGQIITTVSNSFASAGHIAVQADNKIVLVGSAHNTGQKNHGVMLRYMPDGKGLDSTFGVNGKVESYIDSFLIPGGSSGLRRPIVLPDGRILASVGPSFITRRFLSDGRPDSSFQGTGITYLNPSTAGMEAILAYDMKRQTDGKILCTGKATLGFTLQNVITVRFTADGDPDTTFGPSHEGYVMTDISAWGLTSPTTYSVLIQSDGKIVVAGLAYGTSKKYEFLLRYHTNGILDSTFGSNGLVMHNFSNYDYWAWGDGAFLQSDDKILLTVLPENPQSANADMGFVRFLPNGKVDSTYGTNGIISKHFSMSGCGIQSGLILPDNSLIVSGAYTDDNTQLGYHVFLHYDINGILDPNFQYYSGEFTAGFVLDNNQKILGCSNNSTEFGMNRFFSGFTLGLVNKSDEGLALKIFPNPSDKMFTLQYSLTKPEKVSISLWNQQGQKIHVFQENQVETTGEHSHQFDVPDYLPSGTYFIQVETSKGIYTTKWIK